MNDSTERPDPDALLARVQKQETDATRGRLKIYFGSSAGVALSNMFSQARSVGAYVRHGWHVAVAYVVGFFIMLATIGFHPDTAPKGSIGAPAEQQSKGQ